MTSLAELDGRGDEVPMPAAERLADKCPLAAGLLSRRMPESILARGSSRRCSYAARNLRHSASLAGPVADDGGTEGHDAFVAPLRRGRSRKYSF
jgi:hypothetical protein